MKKTILIITALVTIVSQLQANASNVLRSESVLQDELISCMARNVVSLQFEEDAQGNMVQVVPEECRAIVKELEELRD
ncbi:hypothetical protein [Bacteriovorax sp. DB6_IX]|uniref:hypothetical protein n=1 Tax=Bacteriovorax sp. DB6_IX TaxID=1353530 RepID=UPI00038A2B1D|nr:hypothetical protein [Bacteriovorax sp. DB6_IX]EQC44449.1 hypothetical protein M901_0309 [Bacteriovorax sp. DB6_IX]